MIVDKLSDTKFPHVRTFGIDRQLRLLDEDGQIYAGVWHLFRGLEGGTYEDWWAILEESDSPSLAAQSGQGSPAMNDPVILALEVELRQGRKQWAQALYSQATELGLKIKLPIAIADRIVHAKCRDDDADRLAQAINKELSIDGTCYLDPLRGFCEATS